MRLLKAREFHQIAGRAGRAGFDTLGTVIVQAPDHVIESEKAVAKAAGDPKKLRKLVRKKPPEGFVGWGKPTFERLVASEPEPLTSSFHVSHAMVLNVIERGGHVFANMRHLLTDNHETAAAQRAHIRRAIAIYRGLRAAGIVTQAGGVVRVVDELQLDFALNQPLSPFAVAAIELLDRTDPGYALDVVSVVESTLEDPRQVLYAQQDRVKSEAVAQMKADGLSYEERVALLEEITYPKPLAELLEVAFESYRKGHPWVADQRISPKSVLRDLYSQGMTFVEYVGYYGLARSEGLVLRYLADAYKALKQTVPDEAKTEELEDLIEWLAEMVRQVDSSLLDEWERLQNPDGEVAQNLPPAVTRNVRAFRVQVRNALFRRVELAALQRYEALRMLDPEVDWEVLEEYFDEYDEISTGPDARGPKMVVIEEGEKVWRVRQILADPEGDHDWGITAVVDLVESDEAGAAAVKVTGVGQFHSTGMDS
jgi:hypothetical protein